jgi:trehalose 6-phosphate synthase/phosphatase
MSEYNLTEGDWGRIADYVPKGDYTSQSIGQEVPVTPGVHQDGQTAYFEKRPTTSSEKKAFSPAGATPGPRWNPNQHDSSLESSAGVALIRRLARASITGTSVEENPIKQWPSLSLTGRIISATFNVPYSIGFTPGKDWVGFSS